MVAEVAAEAVAVAVAKVPVAFSRVDVKRHL